MSSRRSWNSLEEMRRASVISLALYAGDKCVMKRYPFFAENEKVIKGKMSMEALMYTMKRRLVDNPKNPPPQFSILTVFNNQRARPQQKLKMWRNTGGGLEEIDPNTERRMATKAFDKLIQSLDD